jgi:homoserine O-acetyltransferase
VFLEGVKSALLADPEFDQGRYTHPPEKGLRAFGRVYAGWAYSAKFFREGLYRELGFSTLESFLCSWEDEHARADANNLLAMLWTWQNADVSSNERFGNDFPGALRNIRARTLVMPCDQDLYFTLEENRLEVTLIEHAVLRPFHSAFGHCAGAPGRVPADMAFLDRALRELLASC